MPSRAEESTVEAEAAADPTADTHLHTRQAGLSLAAFPHSLLHFLPYRLQARLATGRDDADAHLADTP